MTEKKQIKRRWRNRNQGFSAQGLVRYDNSVASNDICCAVLCIEQLLCVAKLNAFRFLLLLLLFGLFLPSSLHFVFVVTYRAHCLRWFHCIFSISGAALRNRTSIDTCSSSLKTFSTLDTSKYFTFLLLTRSRIHFGDGDLNPTEMCGFFPSRSSIC